MIVYYKRWNSVEHEERTYSITLDIKYIESGLMRNGFYLDENNTICSGNWKIFVPPHQIISIER